MNLKRTAICSELANHLLQGNLIVESGVDMPPLEKNATLAFCEIAVSLPPEWFTFEEKLAVMNMTEKLYGDSLKFIEDISSGFVSFVNKCDSICNGRKVESFVEVLHRAHLMEFGEE